jgi:hypothetical protein
MKYQKIIDQIRSGALTRAELQTMRDRAAAKFAEGDEEARAVLKAIDSAVARDHRIVFMGFCPSGELANRVDGHWKANGICNFDYDESVDQMTLFRSICAGDLIILKKTEVFGQLMSLHGHGRVSGMRTGADGRRELLVDWSPAVRFAANVPMMGCQSTVNLREMQTVEGAMPPEFFEWALLPKPSA